jgi:hypothetical protein
MCWSGEASAALAAVGFGATAYAAVRNEPPALWLALGYFTLMEALQAFTYSVIDDCASPANQIATLLGYLHIVFQPFFVNALSLHFVPEQISKRIAPWVYTLCFVSSIVMLIQLYPFSWAGTCDAGWALCGSQLCSVSGNWHIAWDIPVNGLGNAVGFPSYVIAMFVVPALYGAWRITFFLLLGGPVLAYQLTDNINETAAVWCLLSIGLLLIVMTPVRRVFYVENWWLWPKTWLIVRRQMI